MSWEDGEDVENGDGGLGREAMRDGRDGERTVWIGEQEEVGLERWLRPDCGEPQP